MKSHILSLALCLLSISGINAQQVYHITDFSDKYAAKIISSDIPNDNEYFSSAYVIIYEKATGLELIKDSVEIDIAYEKQENDSISSNIIEIPYRKQSVIICDDFNCDGEDDLAIKIGNYSCYGGPAYNVYIANNGKLKFHEEYTRLAQEYCGFFEYDCAEKKIHTMTKSGCCWHQSSTFDIINGEPVLSEVLEEAYIAGVGLMQNTLTTWKDGEETVIESISTESIDENKLFSFDMEKKNKEVLLFRSEYEDLIYCFVNKDEAIYGDEGSLELLYNGDFIMTQEGNKTLLSFTNEDANYTIYSSDKEVGIIVETKGKKYKMAGKLESKKNDLSLFRTLGKMKNLTIK